VHNFYDNIFDRVKLLDKSVEAEIIRNELVGELDDDSMSMSMSQVQSRAELRAAADAQAAVNGRKGRDGDESFISSKADEFESIAASLSLSLGMGGDMSGSASIASGNDEDDYQGDNDGGDGGVHGHGHEMSLEEHKAARKEKVEHGMYYIRTTPQH